MRLDVFLANRGLAKSRSFARTLIEGGYVTVESKVITKVSYEVTEESSVSVTGSPYEYVSRGGVKLRGALDFFGVSAEGAVCVDIGASSGGFTDCLLRDGAVKVYAVDSGRDQLDPSLLKDSRVVSMEGFNARYMTEKNLGERCDIAVTDVSFISQTLIHGAVRNVLRDDGCFISLIKPQFECEGKGLNKNGILKDVKITAAAVRRVLSSAEEAGLNCIGLTVSPVKGGDGNTEFLMLCCPDAQRSVTDAFANDLCEKALAAHKN